MGRSQARRSWRWCRVALLVPLRERASRSSLLNGVCEAGGRQLGVLDICDASEISLRFVIGLPNWRCVQLSTLDVKRVSRAHETKKCMQMSILRREVVGLKLRFAACADIVATILLPNLTSLTKLI